MATKTLETPVTNAHGQTLAENGLPTVGYCKVKQAAGILAMSRSALYAMGQRGEIDLRRIGRACLVPWSEVHRLLND